MNVEIDEPWLSVATRSDCAKLLSVPTATAMSERIIFFICSLVFMG